MAIEKERCLRIFRCSVRCPVVVRRSRPGRYSADGTVSRGSDKLDARWHSPLFPFVRGKKRRSQGDAVAERWKFPASRLEYDEKSDSRTTGEG